MELNDLTMRDIANIERLSGQSITNLEDEDAPKGKLFAAMVYVVRHKEDKDFTFDDALDLPMSALTGILSAEEEAPKEA